MTTHFLNKANFYLVSGKRNVVVPRLIPRVDVSNVNVISVVVAYDVTLVWIYVVKYENLITTLSTPFTSTTFAISGRSGFEPLFYKKHVRFIIFGMTKQLDDSDFHSEPFTVFGLYHRFNMGPVNRTIRKKYGIFCTRVRPNTELYCTVTWFKWASTIGRIN